MKIKKIISIISFLILANNYINALPKNHIQKAVAAMELGLFNEALKQIEIAKIAAVLNDRQTQNSQEIELEADVKPNSKWMSVRSLTLLKFSSFADTAANAATGAPADVPRATRPRRSSGGQRIFFSKKD